MMLKQPKLNTKTTIQATTEISMRRAHMEQHVESGSCGVRDITKQDEEDEGRKTKQNQMGKTRGGRRTQMAAQQLLHPPHRLDVALPQNQPH
jgi:hypothetical protein